MLQATSQQTLLTLLLGADLALAVLLCIWVAKERGGERRLQLWLMLVLTGEAAYSLLLGKSVFLWNDALRAVLRVFAAGAVGFLWLSVRAVFDDYFRPRFTSYLPPLVLLGGALLTSLWPRFGGIIVIGLTSLLAMHLVWLLLIDRSVDLDEGRRRLRPLMVGLAGIYIIAMTWGKWWLNSMNLQSYYEPCSLSLLILIKLLVMQRIGQSGNPLSALLARPRRGADGQRDPGAATDAIDKEVETAARDAALAHDMADCIRSKRLYADSSLTLNLLAQAFDLPEYRLRHLINRVLGQRNFNVFLNRFRLDEAVRRLADPAQSELPVLTIALDVGFGSIGPFNRAFKARYQVTPTEFRQMGIVEQARCIEQALA